MGDEKIISTTEASEISGYSKDYVGQLCREGKLDCRRISGQWHVDEESLKKYKQGEVAQSDEEDEDKSKYGMKVGNVRDDTFRYDGVEFVSTARGASLTGYAQDYVGQLARNGGVAARKVGRRWFVGRQALLDHKKHNDDLLGAVQAESTGASNKEGSSEDSKLTNETVDDLGSTKVSINPHVDPGTMNFNVRYISETDKPLVPKIPMRNSLKEEYAPGDIDKAPIEEVAKQMPTHHAHPSMHPGIPRDGHSSFNGSRQGSTRVSSKDAQQRTFTPKPKKPKHFGLGVFLGIFLLALGLTSAFYAYFYGLTVPNISTLRQYVPYASTTEFVESFRDSYGDLVPGSKVDYTKEN